MSLEVITFHLSFPRFKLHLRSKVGASRSVSEMPPLPLNKTVLVVEVYTDFLRYLFECASSYIQDMHANGPDLRNSVKSHIEFVLSHPNGWEGTQQSEMRRAAVLAGLVPDNASVQSLSSVPWFNPRADNGRFRDHHSPDFKLNDELYNEMVSL